MTFIKGQSGNPNGRPKEASEFQRIARRSVDELVLKAWDAEVREKGEGWLKASELLAAYAYGKPSQSIDLTAEVTARDTTPRLTNDERRGLLALQLAAENK